MKIAALLTIAFVSSTSPTAPDRSVQDELTQEEIVALERERYQRVTVPVSVHGQGPYRFLVDTGAEATVVSQEIATSVSLTSAGRALVVGMASAESAELVDVENLVMGNMDFCCLTSPVLAKDKIGADGIIGLDSLQDSRVLLDFEADTLTVHDARPGLSQSGFELVIRAKERLGQLVITSAKVDGIPTDIIIDTGSQFSLGNFALQKRLRARDRGSAEWQDVHGNNTVGNVAVANDIKVGGVSIVNIPIAFADAPPFQHLGMIEKPAMILGMEQLRLFRRVAIDFQSRRILFDLPPGVVPVETVFRRATATRLRDD